MGLSDSLGRDYLLGIKRGLAKEAAVGRARREASSQWPQRAF